MPQAIFEKYLGRFFTHPVSLSANLPAGDLYIVIPSYCESSLEVSLTSIDQAVAPNCKVVVVVVLNDRGEPEEQTFHSQQRQWLSAFRFSSPSVILAVLSSSDMAGKNGGVGLARKIGMDAVIVACAKTGQNPALVCLDADCLVSETYLQALENNFVKADTEVVLLEFSHQRSTDPTLQNGIEQYELFLEYYRLGLKRAGYPFHYHTVGSSMGCKAIPYARSGGMNQRKAGEDFYFLHKLFPFYKTFEIPGPLVFPSPRISKRVPFGTGRFQQGWVAGNQPLYASYHPAVFDLLRGFLADAHHAIAKGLVEKPFSEFSKLHPEAMVYLESIKAGSRIETIRNSAIQLTQRKKALYQWFDGLMALRFVHHFRIGFQDQVVENSLLAWIPNLSATDTASHKITQVRKFLSQAQQ